MKIFKDRKSAGKLLARHLKQYKGQKNIMVLGIPRGGVVVAAEVAESLKLPLDIIVTRKIGHPNQPELAVGAVDEDGEVVDSAREFGEISELMEIVKKEVAEIKRREAVYRQGKKPLDIAGKTIILVDDGIATGSTTLAAINYLKKHQAKKIILAVPVASQEAVEKVIKQLGEVGEVIVLETPQYFQAVGQFYYQFEPVEDEEVVQLLKQASSSGQKAPLD